MRSDGAIHAPFSFVTWFRHFLIRRVAVRRRPPADFVALPSGTGARFRLTPMSEDASWSAPPAAAASIDQPKNQQEHDGADGGGDDRGDQPPSEMNTQFRQQPSADERADDANADIRDQAE